MRFQLTAKWPALTDTFVAADEAGRAVYQVKAKALSLRDTLVIRDGAGHPVAELRAALLGKGFSLRQGEHELAKVGGERRPRIHLADERGPVTVQGDLSGREYELHAGGRLLATVSHRFFSLIDTYGLDVPRDEDALLAVGLVTALHRLHAQQD